MGKKSLAGVLGQCTTLARLNVGGNAVGTENLAVVLGSVQRWFISFNVIGAAGVESLSVLGQYAARSYLNLRNDRIGAAGAESFAGVLMQCPVLVQCWLTSI